MPDGVPAGIVNIIGGTTQNIVVATSKVPAFDDDVQSSLYGYWMLGALDFILVNFETPSFVFHPKWEVLAVHSVEDTKTEQFNRLCCPCRLEISSHFINIFTNITPPTLPSCHGSPIGCSTHGYSPHGHSPHGHSPHSAFETPIIGSCHSSVSFNDQQHPTPSPLVINNTGVDFGFGFGDVPSQPVQDPSTWNNSVGEVHFLDNSGSDITQQPSISQHHRNVTMINKVCNEHHIP